MNNILIRKYVQQNEHVEDVLFLPRILDKRVSSIKSIQCMVYLISPSSHIFHLLSYYIFNLDW